MCFAFFIDYYQGDYYNYIICTLVRSRFSILYLTLHTFWAATRAGPRKRVGRLMGRVDVVILIAAVRNISWAAARAGP